MIDFAAVGLGLQYGTVALVRAEERWGAVAEALAAQIETALDHAHGVEFEGEQWIRYLQFRELLRRDAAARRTYEDVKLDLAARFPDGRKDYLTGKDPRVRQLLRLNG